MSGDSYNYAIFEGQDDLDFDGFSRLIHPGQKAPDAVLTDLEGAQVTLSSLWRTHHVMLGFGSYT
jgi:hypothetical protein